MKACSAIAIGVLALLPGLAASADTYPNRPIRLIVPNPAGGTPDSHARSLAQQLTGQVGQTIVVDNRSGANGIIGADLVAKAAPDGYTLLFTTQTLLIGEKSYRKLPYNVIKDFAPILKVDSSVGYLLIASPSLPARTLQELIALAKKSDKIAYGSTGVGSSQHLAGELFNQVVGTRLMHVPYRGMAPAVTAVMGGDEVQLAFVPPTVVVPMVKSGKLRGLAMTSQARWPVLPDVPTADEAGARGYKFDGGWHGLFAPAHTPDAIIARLQKEVVRAVQAPRVRDYLVAGGYNPEGSTTVEFRAFIAADLDKWGKLLAAAHIQPQ